MKVEKHKVIDAYCSIDETKNYEILFFPFPDVSKKIVIVCFSTGIKNSNPLYFSMELNGLTLLSTNFRKHKEAVKKKIKTLFQEQS